jgi:hypothetical protein
MKHETVMTFGDNEQYELVDTECAVCLCDLSLVQTIGELSLPLCAPCETAMEFCKYELEE